MIDLLTLAHSACILKLTTGTNISKREMKYTKPGSGLQDQSLIDVLIVVQHISFTKQIMKMLSTVTVATELAMEMEFTAMLRFTGSFILYILISSKQYYRYINLSSHLVLIRLFNIVTFVSLQFVNSLFVFNTIFGGFTYFDLI